MKIWINAGNEIIKRPPSSYTSGAISDASLAAEKAKDGIRLVDAPDCDPKYWLPFDGTRFREMLPVEKEAVDAEEAKAKADAEKAKADEQAAREKARDERRAYIREIFPDKKQADIMIEIDERGWTW
jgi:membrane protein involved in colicin uptake